MTNYKINKGEHVSKPRVKKLWFGKDEFAFTFVLGEDCWYPEGSIEHDGINKVCGVSFGIHAEQPFGKIPFLKEFVNSVVVGWRPDYNIKNAFRINIINDNRGVETRPSFPISVVAGKTNTVRIKRYRGAIHLSINGVGKYYYMNTPSFGYYLGFYHGGKSPAPQVMNAKISWTNK